jgi:AmmeMemoRadiSam system protein B
MHAAQDRPRLRPGLAADKDGDPRCIQLWDRLHLTSLGLRLDLVEFAALDLFDGSRTLNDIQADVARRFGGRVLPLPFFSELLDKLERACFLEGPRFQERLNAPVREPACVGCYPADPARLRQQLRGLFTHPKGPGAPRPITPDGALVAALLPHIDYARGGATYAWGFKELVEHSDASLFVILGTSHYSLERFTLTRKHFKTPLGIVETDQQYIGRLAAQYGAGLFDDPYAHLPEHSIELEVLFLQYLYEGRRPFRIVPLVVGAFQDCVEEGRDPSKVPDIQRMVAALRRVERQTKEPICYLISGDLAHIGPKFGDEGPLTKAVLAHSHEQDLTLVRAAEAVDRLGYFRVLVKEKDQRRICGFPPTWTLLEALRPRQGRLLHYDQYVETHGLESVSFASMAFYR